LARSSTECIGETCDFGTLLDENGKLGKNWVRGALLSIERDHTEPADVQEVFVLFDTDLDGKLSEEEIEEVFKVLGCPLSEEAQKAIYAKAKDADGLVELQKFETEYAASEIEMQSVGDGLKGIFEFGNVIE